MKKLTSSLALLTAGLLLATPQLSPAVVQFDWDGNGAVGGNWNVGANWQADYAPLDGTVPSSAAAAGEGQGNANAYVGGASSEASPVVINSAVPAVQKFYVGEGRNVPDADGFVSIQAGGSFSVAENFSVGDVAGFEGRVDIADGTFNVTGGGGSNPTIIGGDGDGTVTVSGTGTYTSTKHVRIGEGAGTGTGVLSITDASTINFGLNLEIGNGTGGTGTLILDGSVEGAGTNVVMTSPGSDRFILGANGTLAAVIDQDAIDTPAAMRMIVTDSSGVLESGGLISMSFDPLASPEMGTWTLIDAAQGFTDNGIALDAASLADGWTFAIVDGIGAQQLLQVSWAQPVPEPTGAALLAGGLGLLLLRRRR